MQQPKISVSNSHFSGACSYNVEEMDTCPNHTHVFIIERFFMQLNMVELIDGMLLPVSIFNVALRNNITTNINIT